LDLVRAVETLSSVAPCSIGEMFEGVPTVQALCSTSDGDELGISYRNDPLSPQAIEATCDQFQDRTGQLFARDGARWLVSLTSQQGPTSQEMAGQLGDLLGVQPLECSG